MWLNIKLKPKKWYLWNTHIINTIVRLWYWSLRGLNFYLFIVNKMARRSKISICERGIADLDK
jgi:hypothetical protein